MSLWRSLTLSMLQSRPKLKQTCSLTGSQPETFHPIFLVERVPLKSIRRSSRILHPRKRSNRALPTILRILPPARNWTFLEVIFSKPNKLRPLNNWDKIFQRKLPRMIRSHLRLSVVSAAPRPIRWKLMLSSKTHTSQEDLQTILVIATTIRSRLSKMEDRWFQLEMLLRLPREKVASTEILANLEWTSTRPTSSKIKVTRIFLDPLTLIARVRSSLRLSREARTCPMDYSEEPLTIVKADKRVLVLYLTTTLMVIRDLLTIQLRTPVILAATLT